MSNRFLERARELATIEFGGEIPPEVMRLATRAQEEVMRVLRQNQEIQPDTAHLVALQMAEVAVRIACEVLNRERTRRGGTGWYDGFGRVSVWETNGRSNGEHP